MYRCVPSVAVPSETSLFFELLEAASETRSLGPPDTRAANGTAGATASARGSQVPDGLLVTQTPWRPEPGVLRQWSRWAAQSMSVNPQQQSKLTSLVASRWCQ